MPGVQWSLATEVLGQGVAVLMDKRTRSQLNLVTALGRRLDGAVCAGSIANAARSVHQDQLRAGQRQDARAAVEQLAQLLPSAQRDRRADRTG
jgi:hypothetical protein